jgi:hypothetical protein
MYNQTPNNNSQRSRPYYKNNQESSNRDNRDNHDNRDNLNSKNNRDNRNSLNSRDNRDNRNINRDNRYNNSDNLNSRDNRDNRDNRNNRDNRDNRNINRDNRYNNSPNKLRGANGSTPSINHQRTFRQTRQTQQTDSDDLNNYDRINDNKELKQQLIRYIYNNIELSKYKYKIIEYETELSIINGNKYYVSPNYNGISSLLVFTKQQGKYYSFIVDKRSLNYNFSQLDYDTIKIIPIDVKLDESIYNGTIIDGVLLYNNNNNNNNNNNIKNFVINDIYTLRGQNISGDKINYKMINISQYLKAFFKNEPHLNNVYFLVNTLYELNEIDKLVNSYIPKSKYSNAIKGLAFFPELSGTKIIYLYNNCAKDKVIDVDNAPIISKKNIVRKSNVPTGESLIATFRFKKTTTVDVYDLLLGIKIEKDGKKYVKYKNCGIAYIPTKECSYFCNDMFSSNNGLDHVLVDCKYMPEREKWVPIKRSNKNRPDFYDIVQKNIDTLFVTESI